MHVQFEFTKDDLVDASERILARSRNIRAEKRKAAFYLALWTWLIVFAIFFEYPAWGAMVSLGAALIMVAAYPSLYKANLRKRLRALHRERYGEKLEDVNLPVCEVELTPIGVWTRQGGVQIIREWENVEEIKETSDSIDIFDKDGSGVIVRKRAFHSQSEQRQFVELARQYFVFCRAGVLRQSALPPSSPSEDILVDRLDDK
jgi:hypothetical protein